MIDPSNAGKRVLDLLGEAPDECEVEGCSSGGVSLTTLQPLDPIEHSATDVFLCPAHTEWAERRNDLAETVLEELRRERKRIGQEHYDEVRELAQPDDGELSHEVAMGRVDSIEKHRRNQSTKIDLDEAAGVPDPDDLGDLGDDLNFDREDSL